ncbi:hypothetical protein AVEN_182663-1, partial [Araneus ventricosus]
MKIILLSAIPDHLTVTIAQHTLLPFANPTSTCFQPN